MVWAAIGALIGKSELIIMNRDDRATRFGFTANSYIETLEEGLKPLYDGQIFQQDNAPIHTARRTLDWIHFEGINLLLNWPPYSPDLNPIEHVWVRLKEALYKLKPDLDCIQGFEQQRRAIEEALPRAWASIEDSVVRGCFESINRRLQAVIDAKVLDTKSIHCNEAKATLYPLNRSLQQKLQRWLNNSLSKSVTHSMKIRQDLGGAHF